MQNDVKLCFRQDIKVTTFFNGFAGLSQHIKDHGKCFIFEIEGKLSLESKKS